LSLLLIDALQPLCDTALMTGELELAEPTEDATGLVRLYTAAVLGELVGVKTAVIRRWAKRGWLLPARVVRRLHYYDFAEVATARRLAELHAAGSSSAEIERHLAALARYVPHVQRPLAELSLVIEGRHLLVRKGDELVEPSGQLRFDFSTADTADGEPVISQHHSVVSLESSRQQNFADMNPQQMLLAAGELEEEGHLSAAGDMLRAALAAGGPNAEVNFMLAELLYQLGDLSAARERYYVAVELDEDYVEARANLGCVLAETGERELAVAAFEGALAFHEDYADVHYHLARTLDEMQQSSQAEQHWHAFLRLSPDSPWADEARLRLE
jgi:tetratricopeptide (TPR) repeat protein